MAGDGPPQGPKAPGHPTCGTPCLACGHPFRAGDYTRLVALGPGDDEEARDNVRWGLPYNAVAVEVHWSCATGSAAEESHPEETNGRPRAPGQADTSGESSQSQP